MQLKSIKTKFSSVDNLDEIALQNSVEMKTFDYEFYGEYSRKNLLLLTFYSLGTYRESLGEDPLIRLDDITVQFFLYFPDKLQISKRWPFPKTDLLEPILLDLVRERKLFSLTDSNNKFQPSTQFILTRKGYSQLDSVFENLDLSYFDLSPAKIIAKDEVNLEVLQSTFPFRPKILMNLEIFESWENGVPPATTIVELSKILDIPRTSPFQKYINKFDTLVMYLNLYNPENFDEIALKITRFLLIQAFYRYDYVQKDLVEKLNKLKSDFEIEEEAEEAKKIILDDVVASV